MCASCGEQQFKLREARLAREKLMAIQARVDELPRLQEEHQRLVALIKELEA